LVVVGHKPTSMVLTEDKGSIELGGQQAGEISEHGQEAVIWMSDHEPFLCLDQRGVEAAAGVW